MYVHFEYLPLKAGELTGRLSFSSSELDVYQYDLNLTATPAGTGAPVHFRAGLGTSQSQTCRFVNFAKSKVEYSCKVMQTAYLSFQDEFTVGPRQFELGYFEFPVMSSSKPFPLDLPFSHLLSAISKSCYFQL